MKILCVEDDRGLAKLLQVTLAKHHYQVDLAMDGSAGWDFAETCTYDLILLDLVLPKLDGIRFCKQLRANQSSYLTPNRDTPVLLMTALDAVTNKVMGLDAGADDYVVKPFDVEDLLARIRALLRQNQGMSRPLAEAKPSPLLTWGELCVNPSNSVVTYQRQPILLTSKEYKLLELLLRNSDQIFSSSQLLDRLWTLNEHPSEGTVRAHIKGLRYKLRQAGANDIVETVYKQGYRLKPPKTTGEDSEKSIAPATPPTIQAPPASNVPPELWEIWLESRQSYCDRLSIIQQAIISLYAGTLTPERKHAAEREAHTLIGSLGSFGLDEASRLSRQIQQILKQENPLGKTEAEQLDRLTTELQYQMQEKTPNQSEAFSPSCLISASPFSASVLIVDDDLPLARQIAKESLNWGFYAEIALDLKQAHHFLNRHHFDIIILDLNFPNSAESGLDFLVTLRCQYPEIMVAMLTAEESFGKRVEAARLGSQCFLQKPIAPAQVLASVTQLLQQAHQSKTRLLIVDDDPALLNFLRTLLEPYGYELTLLDRPQHFWETLEQTAPDLLILDVELSQASPFPDQPGTIAIPPLSGFDLCKVIRSDPRWNRLPAIFLSAHTDLETIQRSFAAGADDFLSKPIVVTELLTRVRSRLEQHQLWKMAEIDELTGISLRRKSLQDLTRLFLLAKRQHQPFSLAVLDLDLFKGVNDQYGHDMGDRVLSYLGKLLRQFFRQEDAIGRWGGEEFIVGMYGISKYDAMRRLEEVLDRFRQHQFTGQNVTPFQLTFSAGIAQFPDDGEDIQALYKAADVALYQAKAQGRNRILSTISNN